MGWLLIFIIAVFLVILFLINFYRDPQRNIPKGNNIVAPADGKVIKITTTSKKIIKNRKGIFGKIWTLTKDIAPECHVISIFMSPLDVHINRAPIAGKIASIRYKKGAFFEAFNFEKSLENEKNEIVIENKNMKVKVIQIAGFLARRIKCCVKKNQKVNKGDKIGMITLGSQTILLFPKGVADLKIKIDDKVRAGQTIIAELR